jgi:hypothetical protein
MSKPPAISASIEEKLQFLIQSAVDTQAQMSEMRTLLVTNQDRIEKTEVKVKSLEDEVKKLKLIVNSNEQQKRILSVRILGLAPSDDELNGPDPQAATAKLAYDRVIRPILTHAKTSGKLSSIPSCANSVTKAFRTAKLVNLNSSPPIILTLSSSSIKTVIFSSRRDALPPPSAADKANGAKRLVLSEDLTTDSFSFLKALREDKRVNRAWSIDGQIRFIRADDPSNTIMRVRSVYDSINDIFPS